MIHMCFCSVIRSRYSNSQQCAQLAVSFWTAVHSNALNLNSDSQQCAHWLSAIQFTAMRSLFSYIRFTAMQFLNSNNLCCAGGCLCSNSVAWVLSFLLWTAIHSNAVSEQQFTAMRLIWTATMRLIWTATAIHSNALNWLSAIHKNALNLNSNSQQCALCCFICGVRIL